MNRPKQEMPSGRALWTLLWRAVIFFPLGVLILALPVALLCAGTVLIAWSLNFSIMQEWWRAAACVAGLPVLIVVWRVYSRWSAPTPSGEEGSGGYVV
jgi:hypothetical protein